LSYGVKTAVFAGFLALLKYGDVSDRFFWVFLFIAAAVYFYFRSAIHSQRLLFSFLILIFLSLIFIVYWPDETIGFISPISLIGLIISGLSAAFFLILGIKNLFLIERPAFYFLLNNLFFFLIFLFFFGVDFRFPVVKYLLVFILAYLLTGEFLKFFIAGPSRRRFLFSAVSAFIVVQAVWAVSLLPIGFLNSAALLLPVIFILGDFTIHHLDGSLSRRIALRNITILIAAAIIISAASRWGL
jgi:hypothetical protein